MLELACKNWLLALGEFCELTLKFKKCKIIIKHVFLKANIIDTQNSSLPHCFVTFYYYPWHPLFSHPLKVTGPSFSSLLFREFTFEHLKICLKSAAILPFQCSRPSACLSHINFCPGQISGQEIILYDSCPRRILVGG